MELGGPSIRCAFGEGWLTANVTPSTTIGGQVYTWSQRMVWGNHIARGTGVITSSGRPRSIIQAMAQDDDNIVWGNSSGDDDDNIVWGNSFDDDDNIVWGNIAWGNSQDMTTTSSGVLNDDDDNIVGAISTTTTSFGATTSSGATRSSA